MGPALRGQALATLGPSGAQHRLARPVGHAVPEPVALGASAVVGLIGALHDDPPRLTVRHGWLDSDGLLDPLEAPPARGEPGVPAVLRGRCTARRAGTRHRGAAATTVRGTDVPTVASPSRARRRSVTTWPSSPSGGSSTPSDLGFYKSHRTSCEEGGGGGATVPEPVAAVWGAAGSSASDAPRRGHSMCSTGWPAQRAIVHRDRAYP